MITTIIILSLLVIFLGYSTLNVLRKLELYEESIEESDQYVLEIKEQLDKAIQDKYKFTSCCLQTPEEYEVFKKGL